MADRTAAAVTPSERAGLRVTGGEVAHLCARGRGRCALPQRVDVDGARSHRGKLPTRMRITSACYKTTAFKTFVIN